MREALLAGSIVQFKSTGRSLEPLVFSGDVCFLHPVLPGCNSQILPGDIIFCHVQPGNRYYTHLVWRTYKYKTKYDVEKDVFIIGNNRDGDKKKCNGWCFREHIYGILTQTQHGDIEIVREERFEDDCMQ